MLELVSKKSVIKTGDKKVTKKTQGHRDRINKLIHEQGEISAAEVRWELGLKSSQARQILCDMVDDSLIETDGENKNRRYRAKE